MPLMKTDRGNAREPVRRSLDVQNTGHWRVRANALPSVHCDRFYTDHNREWDGQMSGCESVIDGYAPLEG